MSKKRRKRPILIQRPTDSPPKKTRAWTVSTVIGLILTTLGALSVIELRPQLTVSAGSELATNEPFSATFEITNGGYLNIHVDDVVVVEHRVEFGRIFTATDVTIHNRDWDRFDLKRGESKTILARFSNGMPTSADMVIAIDYRSLLGPDRWFSRFQGMHIQNWQWSRQPMDDEIRDEINSIVDRALANFRLHQSHVR